MGRSGAFPGATRPPANYVVEDEMSNLPLGPEPKKVPGLQAEPCNDCGGGKPLQTMFSGKQRLRLCKECTTYRVAFSTPVPTPHTTAENPGPEARLSPSQQLVRFFANSHLPDPLRQISMVCENVATQMEEWLPDGPEKTMGLRKLLEAKDCFVRAALPPPPAYPLIPKSDKLAEIDGEA